MAFALLVEMPSNLLAPGRHVTTVFRACCCAADFASAVTSFRC